LEFILVKVLIPWAPEVGILRFFFFLLERQQCSSGRVHAGYVTPCRVLVVVSITSFFSSGGWSSCSLMGVQRLFCSHRSLFTVGGRPPSTSRVVDYHSVEELGFQPLDRRDRTLLQGGAV
jgi:hypothetical protein